MNRRAPLLALLLLLSLAFSPSPLAPSLACGDVLTSDTTLTADLDCPAGTAVALEIGASNLTLDLGGHTLRGPTPGIGILAIGRENLTLRSGTIEGFDRAILLIEADTVTVEDLAIRNLASLSPDELILGVAADHTRDLLVQRVSFAYPSVAHKEAVELYASQAAVQQITVQGGGAGVNFSFAGECDPVNAPNTGVVQDSRFSDIYIAAIEVQCTGRALITRNIISGALATGIGVQGDAPFPGAVTGLVVENNLIQDAAMGIELRGILNATVRHNAFYRLGIWGIAVRRSLGCFVPIPGWECFDSTGNTLERNLALGSGADLYHDSGVSGNTWLANLCETKDGAEIPDCAPPLATCLPFIQTGPR